MRFTVSGHKNILALHRNTIEFTKSKELTLRGDCVIGVNADFKLDEIKKISKNKKIRIKIRVDDLAEEINAEVYPDFDCKDEIVVRRTDFLSKRTLGIKADKAAVDIDRKIIEKMKDPKTKMVVEIEKAA